jgi:hypothetical protein
MRWAGHIAHKGRKGVQSQSENLQAKTLLEDLGENGRTSKCDV